MAASYTNANVTFDAKGRATAASNGVTNSAPRLASIVTSSSLILGATDSTKRLDIQTTEAEIISVATNRPAWVRIYRSTAHQVSDISRTTPPMTTDDLPSVSSGRRPIIEILTEPTRLIVELNFPTPCANTESPIVSTLPMTIQNRDTVTGTVIVSCVIKPK